MPAAPAPAPSSAPAPNITRVLLKLHYLLWTRSLKSNKSAMIMNIFIALYALIGLTVSGRAENDSGESWPSPEGIMMAIMM